MQQTIKPLDVFTAANNYAQLILPSIREKYAAAGEDIVIRTLQGFCQALSDANTVTLFIETTQDAKLETDVKAQIRNEVIQEEIDNLQAPQLEDARDPLEDAIEDETPESLARLNEQALLAQREEEERILAEQRAAEQSRLLQERQAAMSKRAAEMTQALNRASGASTPAPTVPVGPPKRPSFMDRLKKN